MSDTEQVEISLVQGEDFALQIFYTDDYDAPVPLSGPILMDVQDGYGQIALRFLSGQSDATKPQISYNGPKGFIQLTAPKERTRELLPGTYLFDLFASVTDPAGPFTRQQQRIFSGMLTVEKRYSVVEDVSTYLSAQGV